MLRMAKLAGHNVEEVQNGCSEDNSDLVEAVRATSHADFSPRLWDEIVQSAAYVLNRTGPTTVKGKTPYELWMGKRPDTKLHWKLLEAPAVEGLLVGYDKDGGYRIWDKKSNHILRSRNVTFGQTTTEEERWKRLGRQRK